MCGIHNLFFQLNIHISVLDFAHMGFDMYLYAMLDSYDMDEEIKTQLQDILKLPYASTTFYFKVLLGSWGRAYHINLWFMNNFNYNNENSLRGTVEKLDDLYNICQRLMTTQDRKLALEILPPLDDEYTEDFWETYWNYVEQTIPIIDTVRTFASNYKNITLIYEMSY